MESEPAKSSGRHLTSDPQNGEATNSELALDDRASECCILRMQHTKPRWMVESCWVSVSLAQNTYTVHEGL